MPQGKTVDREQLLRDLVEVAFDDAYVIREEYTEFLERRKANRDQLRGLAAQGYLSDEQKGELSELYPDRDVTRLTPEERAQRLEEQAAAVRKKAEEHAAKKGAKVAA